MENCVCICVFFSKDLLIKRSFEKYKLAALSKYIGKKRQIAKEFRIKNIPIHNVEWGQKKIE